MSVSVIIATYGSDEWMKKGVTHARPSVGDEAHEIISHYTRNATICEVRNDAAKQASGTHLLFLDADDELAPGYVGAMERAVQQNPGGRVLLTPAVQTVRPNRTPGPPTFFRQVPLRQANWLVIGTLIHRDLFWEVGGFDNHPHGLEDWALWSKCVRAGATVVKVPDAVYRYWVSPDSMHRQLWRDKKRQREEHRKVAVALDEWEAARA